MTTVLVTGAAGFIGSHICNWLLDCGYTVIGLDDLSGGFEQNAPVHLNFSFFRKNTLDDLEVIFQHYRIDYIIHCAAYAAEGLSHFIRRFNYTNNVLGSVNLINMAIKHDVKCFVFLSSIAVYGMNKPPFHEEEPMSPCDPYGIAKGAVEMDLRAAHETFGLNYVIFRPFNVYGPHQNIADPYRNVIGIFMNQCMKGEEMTIFGDGEQTRAFSYISDVAPVIARSIDNPHSWNQVFNIGGDTTYTVRELASRVAEAMDADEIVEHLPARHEAKHAYCDTFKVNHTFEITKKPVSLDTGLFKMAEWVKKRGPQSATPFASLELTRGLPGKWAKLI